MALHARHEHDAGDPHAQHHEEGIDQPSDGGVVSTRTAWAQQARSAATKARNLQGKTRGHTCIKRVHYSPKTHPPMASQPILCQEYKKCHWMTGICFLISPRQLFSCLQRQVLRTNISVKFVWYFIHTSSLFFQTHRFDSFWVFIEHGSITGILNNCHHPSF